MTSVVRSVLPNLVVFAMPSPVGAEMTVYFAGHAVEVPAWFQLLVFGLALLAVGRLVKSFRHFLAK
jgi:hypothetical protein